MTNIHNGTIVATSGSASQRPSMPIDLEQIEEQLTKKYLSVVHSWERRHPGCSYRTPRPVITGTLVSTERRVVEIGPYHSRFVALEAVAMYAKRLESVDFVVAMPGDGNEVQNV